MIWPEGKTFAFTIIDDPDAQSESQSRLVYGFLAGLGFRSTKGVWPVEPRGERNSPGDTCENKSYRRHCQELASAGFEMGFHNAAPGSVSRPETIEALDRFRDYFGQDPSTLANHYNQEAIYWGPARLTGKWRLAYNVATMGRNAGRHWGHVEGHPSFWGDVCRERIRYCRNFAFAGVNTLSVCPWMPYRDPLRPYVRQWFAATEGANRGSYNRVLAEGEQDRLEREGGASIIYTHFGHYFVDNGRLDARFTALMRRLSRKNGWFVPVATLLDYLGEQNNVPHILTDKERSRLEFRWLCGKLLRGTS